MDDEHVYRGGVQGSHGKKMRIEGTVSRMRAPLLQSLAAVTLFLLWPTGLQAQERGGGTSATAKASAPIDLTGYWVSVVTQDWRWRMVTPARGDYESIPITLAAKKAGDAWDPARDEAAGEQCKSYAAPALMAIPTRLHITWQDENTLKVETDAGTQTRRFHFGNWKPQDGAATWQGESIAQWETARAARGVVPKSGSLKVVTTHLRPGYLRKNGVPYSANATLTEYFDRINQPSGDSYLVITTTVEDPMYLNQPFLTSTHFKKQADASGWNPTPCAAR